jgi:hypothetical protein
MASSRPAPPNPRGGDRRGVSRLSRPSSPLWYGLVLLLVLGMAQAYYMAPPGRSIPYSEFKQLVKNGEVAEISIGDQAIRGTLKAGDAKTKAFTVTRVDDPKLTEELEARGVKYTGEVMNRWLPELLGWVIPLLFLVGIWGFFFRRMSGAEGGVMSFARSKAKIYADDEVKVRWPEIVAARQVEKAPDRAIFWDRVIAGARRAEPVEAVVICMKNAPQVHFWLDFRLLNIIEAVLVRHPDIKGGAGDGAAVGVGDASRNRKRHSLAIQRYIVAEGALGRRGDMEWAEHGRLSRSRGLSVANGVNQHGHTQDVG